MKKEPIALPADPADARISTRRPKRWSVAGVRGSSAPHAPRSACRRPSLPYASACRSAHCATGNRRVSPPDFAVAYVKVIGQYPEMVARAVA